MDGKWILFLLAVIHAVASAPESMFALEGNSVIFTMQKHGNLDPDDAVWVVNQTKDVVRYYPHNPQSHQLWVPNPYKDRVEFNSITFSLELKSLQKTDSGLYRGEINSEGGKNVVEYRLCIVEPVSAPVLTVEPVPSSGDLWNVSCRAGDLSLTTTCNSNTCTQEEQTMSSSLAVSVKDGVITCSHSNSVSWSHATVEIGTVFLQEQLLGEQNILFPVAGGLFISLILIGALLCVFHKRIKSPVASTPKKLWGKLRPGSAEKKQNPSIHRPLVKKDHSQTPGLTLKKRGPAPIRDHSSVVLDLSQQFS